MQKTIIFACKSKLVLRTRSTYETPHYCAGRTTVTDGPSAFVNPYNLLNMALYGNLYGPNEAVGGGSSGGGGTMDALYGTYGYHVTHEANSVYNYCFPGTQLRLVRNWQDNPSISTNRDLRGAGITDLTVGVVGYGNGRRSSFYQWSLSGNAHTAEVLNEYVGGTEYGSYSMTVQPLDWYGVENRKNDVAGAIPKTPHYLSVPKAVAVVGGQATMVQSAAYLTQKTCQGAEVFGSIGKVAGRISGAISVGTVAVSTYNRYEYYKNGGVNVGVAVIGATDVGFTIAGFFWPWGTVASAVYFSTEMITDDFWEWGKVR